MSVKAQTRKSGRRCLVVGLALSLISVSIGVGAADEPTTATLHWVNGDQMPGQLLGSTSSELRWKSKIFTDPFSLDLLQLVSVRFPQSEQLAQDEPLRFITHTGDVLYGQLVDVSDRHLVIGSKRHGQVKLPQSALRTFRRLNDEGLIYLGPTGTLGWRTVSAKRRTSEWTTNTEGELSTSVLGAELFRDFQLPEIAEIELVLRWRRRPGFLITFADPSSLRLSHETVRLETWEDELVLQTLAGNGDFEQLATLDPDTKSIQLRLLWNQRSGELSVYSEHGELLGKMTAGPETGKNHAGLYIKNKGSDLTLAQLRVSSWSGVAPSSTAVEASCVRLVNGDLVYGQIQSYDKETASLVVARLLVAQRIALSKIASVFFGESSDVAPGKPQVMLSYYDGTLLRGSLESIAAGTAMLKTDYCEQPIAAQLHGASRLQFAGPPDTVPASDAVLEMKDTKLHGQLAPAGPTGSDLGWQPLGSSNASPLPKEHPARIVREAKADENFLNDNSPDVVYLRNGDILPCRVTLIDETHLVIDSAFAAAAQLPLGITRAIEFGADAYLPVSGFAGRGWTVTETEKGTVQRSDKGVVFRGQATLGHQDVVHGDEIGFDMHWNAKTPVAMTVSFYTRDEKRATSPSVLIYCVQQQLFVRGIRGGHQLIQAGPRRDMFKDKEAQLKFKLGKKQLEVFVNQAKVLSQTLTERDRAGKGMVLAIQRLDGARRNARKPQPPPEDLLTLSNFHVGRSAGPFGSLQVEDDEKDVVLTVPRSRKQNPPTHVLVAQNGDLLRGRLLGLTDKAAHFTSRLDAFAFPRERLAGIIWLEQESDEPPPTPDRGVVAQVVFASGATLTFNADQMVQDRIVGSHPILGPCSVPRGAVRELRVGQQSVAPTAVAYSDWTLRPAKEPQFAGGTASAPLAGASPGLDSPLVGTVAGDFEASLLDGKPFRLSDHTDKVVILDFWATWCGPCVRALPQVIETAEAFPPGEVLLVAINQQENAETIRDFLKARGLQMTVALDRDGKIGRQFQVEAIPQTVIVGRGGKIERLHVGAHPEFQEQLGNVLKQLVASEDPAG